MSNPFSEHFSRDPLTQRQSDEEQLRLIEAQRIREEQERQRAYEAAVVAEIQRYDSMAVQTLEQLRDAAYPNMGVHRHEPHEALRPRNYPPISGVTVSGAMVVPPITQWWQLGSQATYEVMELVWKDSSRVVREPYFKPVVSLGLQMDGHTATNFVATYHGKHFANREASCVSRTVHASLSLEALVQALIELHKPSKRTEVVLLQRPIVDRVLKRICELPSFSDIRWSGYRLSWQRVAGWPELIDDPRLNPPADVSGQKINISDIDEEFYADAHRMGHSLISVSVVFDAQNNPTHYEFRIEEDQPAIAPLNEEALYAAIEHALILRAEKVKPTQTPIKKKGWFGR